MRSIAWSSNGAYLLTAGNDCQLLLWDVHTRETLDRFKSDVPLVGVAWHANDVALLTRDGELAVWRDVVPTHMPSPAKPDAKAAVFDNDAAKIAVLLAASSARAHRTANQSDDEADAIGGDAKPNGAVDTAADADAADAAFESTIARTAPLGGARLRKKAGAALDVDDDDDVGGASKSASAAARAPLQRHAAFMSTASPMARKRRILGARCRR